MHGLGSCHGTHPLHQLVDKLFYSHFFCLYQHLPVVQIGKHIVDDYTRRSQKPVTEYPVVPGLSKCPNKPLETLQLNIGKQYNV